MSSSTTNSALSAFPIQNVEAKIPTAIRTVVFQTPFKQPHIAALNKRIEQGFL